MSKTYSEEVQRLLKSVCDECKKEDRPTRERQIRTWRRLKLFWESYQRVWYSETAHDWRIWDIQTEDESTDQSYYDKPINIFRAYLESIIAALSVTVPPIKCFPDDAENDLDIQTAKAGDKISTLIYRHNDVALLWLHALFIWATEGMTACYNYPKEDKIYGEYEEKKQQQITEDHELSVCPRCGHVIEDNLVKSTPVPNSTSINGQQPQSSNNPSIPDQRLGDKELQDEEKDEFQPDEDDVELHNELINEGKDICPQCMEEMDPEFKKESFVVTRLVGITTKPKTRICLEAYGGLNVKIPVYARRQDECGYLIYSYEKDYALAVDPYDNLKSNKEFVARLKAGKQAGAYDQYDQWGRLSPQYQGEYPMSVVTIDNYWIRPSKFNVLHNEDDVKKLKKLFPDGVKIVCIADSFAEAEPESLDDCWTINYNPLADYLHYDPVGLLVTSVQEIVNDLVSLITQTIEHGIGQTIADPAFLDFAAYSQTETTPGAIFPSKAIPGNKSLKDGFFEFRTANLSGEVMPFLQNIQSLGQIISGALPSLWGGQIQGSETASQYSMSRSQALQRLQNTWKSQTLWWKNIFGKVIPMYIKEVKKQGEERDVQLDKNGNFINVFIRKAELEGKIGKVELEANENLPLTWTQQKDLIMQLFNAANPEVLKIISAPENLPLIHEAIGLDNFYTPGEDDVEKQFDEIRQLTKSSPIQVPVPPEMLQAANVHGVEPPEPEETPSVEVDPDIDNHAIQFEICRKWLISEVGRETKIDNPDGYKNVLLHAKMHLDIMKEQQAQQAQMMAPPAKGAAPGAKPNSLETQDAPIQGEGDVQTIQ